MHRDSVRQEPGVLETAVEGHREERPDRPDRGLQTPAHVQISRSREICEGSVAAETESAACQ